MMGNVKSSTDSKETRFVCKSCSRTFRRVEHLRRHETSHSGTRPHICPKCKATFFRGDVLVRHMRNVHKTMISGVKELRSASHIPLEQDHTPLSNDAGTSASVNVPHGGPNPQNIPALGMPSSPYGYAKQWVQYQYSPSVGQPGSIYGGSGLEYSIQPDGVHSLNPGGQSPSSLHQQPSAFGPLLPQPQHHIAHAVQNGSPIIASPNPLFAQPNPCIQNLIAYGYGQYPPQQWTDSTPYNSSGAPQTANSQSLTSAEATSQDSNTDISEHDKLHPVDSKRKRARADSISTDLSTTNNTGSTSLTSGSSSGDMINEADGKARDTIARSAADERMQYAEFIPNCYSLTGNYEFQPYNDSYGTEGHSKQRKEGISPYDRDVKPSSRPSYTPQRPLGASGSTGSSEYDRGRLPRFDGPGSHNVAPENIDAQSGSTIDSISSPSTKAAANTNVYSFDHGKDRSLSDEILNKRFDTDSVPENCPACGEPFKSMKGDTHDFSFNLIGSESGFEHILRLLVGTQSSAAPTVTQLDRYISYYASFCHPILPLIHQSTFDPRTARPALLFAICALGANTLQEQGAARLLHFNAERLLAEDWNAILSAGTRKLDIDTWIYLMQTSIYIEWQAFAMASSPRVLSVAERMRDLQLKICSKLPELSFGEEDNALSLPNWVMQQRISRSFANVLSFEYVFVCCYNYEPRCSELFEYCKNLNLPCSELLWNTGFKSESSWRLHRNHELSMNEKLGRPKTFEVLLSGLREFDLVTLKDKIVNWQLLPTGVLLFVASLCIECEIRNVRLDQCEEFLKSLWPLIRDPTPSIGQCAMRSPIDEPSRRSFLPLTTQNFFSLKLIDERERLSLNQHPLIALAGLIIEAQQCGQFVEIDSIKLGMREFDSDLITTSLLKAMVRKQNEEMTHLLPIVSIIVDFIRFGLTLGPKGLLKFNMLYSLSFFRSVAVLLSHRLLSLFCCWIFSAELKVRTHRPIHDSDLRTLMAVEKSCVDYKLPGIVPLHPIQDHSEEQPPPGEVARVSNSPVKLSVTAGILKLLGSITNEVIESIPGKPFYKALLNISLHLQTTAISPAHI